ncbi:MAG TPA: hypothetical protein VKD72_16275, partial [Gemmataceae bacterium]|nr:hypothetical protein [Gemmataceae bacterium]
EGISASRRARKKDIVIAWTPHGFIVDQAQQPQLAECPVGVGVGEFLSHFAFFREVENRRRTQPSARRRCAPQCPRLLPE